MTEETLSPLTPVLLALLLTPFATVPTDLQRSCTLLISSHERLKIFEKKGASTL